MLLRTFRLSGIDSYDLEIDTNGTTNDGYEISTNLTVTNYSNIFTAGDSNYRWRVRGIDAAGNQGVWSNLIFTIDTEAIRDIGFSNVLTSIIHHDSDIHDNQTQSPGSLERALNSIDLLIKKGVRVGVNMVVTKDRVNEVYNTGKFLAERGIKSFSATRVAPNYSDKKILDSLIDSQDVVSIFDQLLSLKDEFGISVSSLNPTPLCFEGNKTNYDFLLNRGCAAGNTNATINSSGFMRSCQHSYEHEGNIVDEGVFAVWKRIPIWKIDYLPEICQDCFEKLSCGGGCRETAKAVTGKLEGADPLARGSEYVLRHLPTKKVNAKEKIRFANDIMTRKEEEGGVFFRNPGSFTILSEEGYNLSLTLKNNVFSIEVYLS